MADEGFWGYAEGFTDSQDRVIVVDRTAIMQASREMVRWGNHYNQAVHALNTIALHFTRGRNLSEQWLTEQIQEIRLQLEAVQEGREGIAAALSRIATFPTMKGR